MDINELKEPLKRMKLTTMGEHLEEVSQRAGVNSQIKLTSLV